MEKIVEKETKGIFRSSLKELESTQTVVFCGLLGAMGAVLKLMTSINIGNVVRIGFDWIPNRIVDFLFGPAVGSLFAAVMDIVKHFLKPMGAFDIRFTLVSMSAGLFYGYWFYKKPISIPRIFIGKLIVALVLNLGVTTYLLSTIYGKGYLALLPGRVTKTAIALPIETLILFAVLQTVSAILKKMKK